MESRTQGSRPRPSTHKKYEAKDSFSGTVPLVAKDRNAWGQGQGHKRKCFQKKGLQIFFSGVVQKKKAKKVFANFPRGFWRFPTKFVDSKNSAVLEPRTDQFLRTWGFEAKPKDLKMCPGGRPRGQERPPGLHFWYVFPIMLIYCPAMV